jgi:hypothetical protein
MPSTSSLDFSAKAAIRLRDHAASSALEFVNEVEHLQRTPLRKIDGRIAVLVSENSLLTGRPVHYQVTRLRVSLRVDDVSLRIASKPLTVSLVVSAESFDGHQSPPKP